VDLLCLLRGWQAGRNWNESDPVMHDIAFIEMSPSSSFYAFRCAHHRDAQGLFLGRRCLGLGDDHYTFVGKGESFSILLGVVADDRVWRNNDAFVDDGSADAGPPADFHIFHDNGLVDVRVTFDADIGREDAVFHATS